MTLDDGVHRAELLLSRDPGTHGRQLSLVSVPTSPTAFTWDANVEDRFEIARGSNGDFTITAVDGGTGAIATKSIPAGALPPSAGTAAFEWGFALEGAGAAFWKSVHAEVNAPSLDVSDPLPRQLSFAVSGAMPARGDVTFRLAMPQTGDAAVSVFDVAGREVRALARGVRPLGISSLIWDGRDAAGTRVGSGIYFARLLVGERTLVRRVVLTR